ncbi:MAG: hypothetical protein EAX87_09195 [Candidatus Thorarchaeota archaeon]|nr:hypothetical protein [Candidatus Thorarchaeota archaeon]
MQKTGNDWAVLAAIGIVFIVLAGFSTGVPTGLDYLDYGLLAGGVVALVFAAIEFRRRKKV